MSVSAGKRLRKDLDAALAHAAKASGQSLEFDERELVAVEMAAAAADRVEQMRLVWETAMLADKVGPTTLANLAAELRLHEKSVVDLISRLTLGVGPAKSERHQRAVNARWNRARPVA